MRVQSPNFNRTPSGALNPYRRVKLDGSNELAEAGNTERALGTVAQRVHSGDQVAAVVPMNAEGTRKMEAGEAISEGAVVYSYANGKIGVTTAGGEHAIGWALEAASGDGSIIEVLVDRNAA
jgi:hypothetical protein